MASKRSQRSGGGATSRTGLVPVAHSAGHVQWCQHTLAVPCAPLCASDLECARFIASRASAILASSSMAARPNATERQVISLFRAQALHPEHTGAAITLLPVLGTKFSIPVRKVFEDELYRQEWISLYFWQKFINRAFQQSLASISSSI